MPPDTPQLRLIYILGASHSGSTLLSMLLGAHPQLCSVGDLKRNRQAMGTVDNYLCSCGAHFLECPFWRRIANTLHERGVPFKLADWRTDHQEVSSSYAKRLVRPLVRGRIPEVVRDIALWLSPTWRREYPQIQEMNVAVIGTITEQLGARAIVDSSKRAYRLSYLWRNPKLHIKVIRLLRDGRAVALTYMKPREFADADRPALRRLSARGMSMSDAARAWRRSNEEAETLLARLPESRYTTVSYEDLCAAPLSTIQRLCRFIDVDASLATTDFRSAEHHVLGNGMRLSASGDIRLDERWRSVLSKHELEEFAKVGEAMNRKLGYV